MKLVTPRPDDYPIRRKATGPLRTPKPDDYAHGLTENNVREIRARHALGETMRSLAREFGVDRSTVFRAIRGDTWGTVPR